MNGSPRPFEQIFLSFLLLGCVTVPSRAEPLASWREGDAKSALLTFVQQATTPGEGYIPKTKRIAVFDNDGTLWAERPIYVQAYFIFDRIKQLSPQHPEWSQQEPFASVLQGHVAKALSRGEKSISELILATHAGMTTEEFHDLVSNWLATARHPETGRPFTEMTYQPMCEALRYLRNKGFKTYIVSGGGVEFMRPWVERVYGVPPEQVIGSSVKTKYEVRQGKPVIVRLAALNFIDDKAGKPVAIQRQIGRRPRIAFGNSDGDFQMLEWTTTGLGPSLGVLIHHTDSDREWAYDRKSTVGRLDKGLDEAGRRSWVVVDMRRDWSTIFSGSRVESRDAPGGTSPR